MKCLFTTMLNGTNFIKMKHGLKESSSREKNYYMESSTRIMDLIYLLQYFDLDWTLEPSECRQLRLIKGWKMEQNKEKCFLLSI